MVAFVSDIAAAAMGGLAYMMEEMSTMVESVRSSPNCSEADVAAACGLAKWVDGLMTCIVGVHQLALNLAMDAVEKDFG